ncbi:MAG: ribonuclease III [Corynebacterium sp.]|nr:ribonuclease III [Corynebacterium sp.]
MSYGKPDYEIWEAAFQKIDHASLMKHFGIELEPERLRLALTHRSFANEHGRLPNNERLEFLGDAVLGLSIAGALYERFPNRPESDISKMRASIVSRYGLADVARKIDLGSYILLGIGEEKTRGHDKDSILADTTEAILGAIYLQYGFETTRNIILHLFKDKIANASASGRYSDWKTTLQERLAERKITGITYETSADGPAHEQTFYATVSANGEELASGTGHNKKLAEQDAARNAVNALKQRP